MKLDRRQFLAFSSSALALSPFARTFAQGQAPPPAVAKFDDVRRNVGIFTMRGGTIGTFVNKDAVLVIDTQYPDTARACLDGLKQKIGNRSIDTVFNTHHHADHTSGNAVFRAAAKRIIARPSVPALQRKAAAAAPPIPSA